ncbi:MAG TPA: carboxypeptidase regulatory-like domain-containing protein, partial [Gemmataceae bacterium]
VDQDFTLDPGVTLSGRVLHDGKPRAGVVMKLVRSIPLGDGRSARSSECGECTTDVDGRYRVGGLKAGDRYFFMIEDPAGMADPGWHYQSPYIQTLRPGADEVKLPDVKLMSRAQTLRGVVVDPQGKPVAGLTVSARLGNGQSLSRPQTGPPPWTETDERGRFELRQLPDQPLELMIYRRSPGGTRIRYPAVVRPAVNAQDIRAVFDPTLGGEVEDLDAPEKPPAKP